MCENNFSHLFCAVPITCSLFPRPSENYTLDASSNSTLVAGCHSDYQINSQATYACKFDSSLKVQTTCNAFGEWEPPIVKPEEWLSCKDIIFSFAIKIILFFQAPRHAVPIFVSRALSLLSSNIMPCIN
jgi:hypothetical protein